MDESTIAILFALLRIAMCFAIIMAATLRHWPLERGLILAALILALSSGLSVWDFGIVALEAVQDMSLWALLCVLLTILMLSGVMDSSGQTMRLVLGVGRLVPSRRLQLFFSPAFIGLFPVAGGAIFSCPMVEVSSRNLGLGNEEKSTLNYWFRHVWELVWPLYPGFILYSALGDFSPVTVIVHNWPSCLAAIGVGWFLYLRHCPDMPLEPSATSDSSTTPDSSFLPDSSTTSDSTSDSNASAPVTSPFTESLPLLVGLSAALLSKVVLPGLESGFAFSLAFLVGIALCLFQNKQSPRVLIPVLVSPKTRYILLMVVAIFIFKATLAASSVVEPLAVLAKNPVTLFLVCALLPLLGGMLSGLMVAYVGISFPVIITMLQQSDMWADRLPWLTLAVMFGNVGQMLSPVHLCLIVTCRYFDAGLGAVLRRILVPASVLALVAVLWFGIQLML